MRDRPGWAPGPGDPGNPSGKSVYEEKRVTVSKIEDLPDVHFLWTQYPVKGFLNAMATRQAGACITLNEEARAEVKLSKAAEEGQGAGAGPVRVHNHFEGNHVLTSKAGLRETMVRFYLRKGKDPFGALPLTFVIRKGSGDDQYAEWLRSYEAIAEAKNQRMWLVKPGTNANRGNGIRICDEVDEVQERVDSKERAWVIQKYMEMPFLVHKRKFDIRAYCLVTQEPGKGEVKAYFFRDAYLRTTSVEYSLKTKDRMAHLNNDAVQKKGEDYGKFESANKLSLTEFQKYLDEHHRGDGLSVQESLMPQMKSLAADSVRAARETLNPRGIDHSFEVFGFDFMVDASFKCWLIEVNSNPCLELCNAHLSTLIPRMLEEALQMTLDRIFPEGAAKGDGRATGWEQIYSSMAPDADEVSCTWVPDVPLTADGTQPDIAMLGASLLTPRLAAKKKKSTKGAGQAA